MKILNIIQCTNLGGMERSNLARLNALQEGGHVCHLVSLNSFGGLLPLLEKSSVQHSALCYEQGKWKTFTGLVRRLKAQEHDAVICTGHNLLATVALPRKRRAHHVMCIHYHHTGVKPEWFWKLYYRLCLKKFAHIFFNSKFIRDEALMMLPALANQSSVLPNIYEMPDSISAAARKEARAKFDLPADGVVIMNAGWLIPRKRFDVFIQTATAIKQALPKACFVIAGDGEEKSRLEQLARELGVNDSIWWLGWQSDMESVYAASDMLLFNTEWDAVARTPIEAGLRGVNVVCSERNGGLRDLFKNPEWVLPEHDVGALAKMTIELLNDPRKREDQIARMRHIIEEECNPSVHIQRIVDRFHNY